jgi:hypothetical protein
MRLFMLFPLLLVAACSAGSQGNYYSYTDPTSDLNRPAEHRDVSTCPEAMPTGGALESDHEGVGSFYCDF